MRLHSILLATLIVCFSGLTTVSHAQISVYRPSYAPVVVSPGVPTAPVVSLPAPVPVTAYRPVVAAAPILPTGVIAMPSPVYAAARPVYSAAPYSVAPYTAARPVVVAPTVPTPIVYGSAATVYRPAVVGTSVAGLPTTYVPGQPIRNALRFAIP